MIKITKETFNVITRFHPIQRFRREFERESRLLGGLAHPNIVRLIGVCVEEDPFYMVFELMEQGDLQRYLR